MPSPRRCASSRRGPCHRQRCHADRGATGGAAANRRQPGEFELRHAALRARPFPAPVDSHPRGAPPGGRFSGQWYGPRDSSVGRPGMTFVAVTRRCPARRLRARDVRGRGSRRHDAARQRQALAHLPYRCAEALLACDRMRDRHHNVDELRPAGHDGGIRSRNQLDNVTAILCSAFTNRRGKRGTLLPVRPPPARAHCLMLRPQRELPGKWVKNR